jgi:hypothetical protein
MPPEEIVGRAQTLNMPAETFNVPQNTVNMPPEMIAARSQTINMLPETFQAKMSTVNMAPETFVARKRGGGAETVDMAPEVFKARSQTIDMAPEEFVGNPGYDFSDSPIALREHREMDFSDTPLNLREMDFSDSPILLSEHREMDFSDSPIALSEHREMDFSDTPISLDDYRDEIALGTPTMRGARKVASYAQAGLKEKKGGAAPAKEAGGTDAEKLAGVQDALLKQYKDKAGSLGEERIKALEQALAEKDLSTEEKVAMALLAVLPGLIGAVGGGAIAGGAGAAAGAAGGLQGGAEGVKGIVASKDARRKEAKSDADQLLEQILQQEGLATRRQEMLEGRDLDAKKTAEERAANKELAMMREAGDNQRSAAQIRASLLAKQMELKSRDFDAQLDAAAKAQGAQGANAPLKQADRDFYANISSAFESIDRLEKFVNDPDIGNWESRFGDPEAAAGLDKEAYELAVAFAKIVDPTSVAREGEVDAAKKYMVPMGFGIPTKVTQAALRQQRETLLRRAQARNQLGTPLPESVNAQLGQGPRQSPATQSSDPASTTKQKYGF